MYIFQPFYYTYLLLLKSILFEFELFLFSIYIKYHKEVNLCVFVFILFPKCSLQIVSVYFKRAW